MRVCITSEHRFKRTPDGKVWTATNHSYADWLTYLDVFEEACIVARVEEVTAAPPTWLRADGKGVAFSKVPYYLGPAQFCRRIWTVQRAVVEALPRDCAAILKAPSTISCLAEAVLRLRRQPFGVEVVGDPMDAFASGAVRHPLRPLFRSWFARRSRMQCARACAVSYVTAHALQARYPARRTALAVQRSDVNLAASWFVDGPREPRTAGPFRLITVGSLEQLHKAPDVLIEAFSECVEAGLDAELVFVGDGRQRSGLENLARKLGMEERIRFAGSLPAGESVIAQLDRSDLFVLASRADGLPRALIEAMARALPCIGSTVGGIPEVLDAEVLVPPGDANALKLKILQTIGDSALRAKLSRRCLDRVREFEGSVLAERKRAFHDRICASTSEWQREGRSAA